MRNAQIFYRECKAICSKRIKSLGFRSSKMHYYRVVDKSVQSFCFYAYGGRREIRFDIQPLGYSYMTREWDGSLWLSDYIPTLKKIALISDGEVGELERDFANIVCHALDNVVLSGFEMANSTEASYCLKRFWLEDCLKGAGQTSGHIYEDYMWYLQLGAYQKAKELLLNTVRVWKEQNGINDDSEIVDENELISYKNLMRPVRQWCEKSDEEIKSEIKKLENRNLEILRWPNKQN